MPEQNLVPFEPRSWEPATLKIDPITSARPSNRELAEGVNQVHLCLEDHRQHTSREFKALKTDVRELKQALGVGVPKAKTVATQSTRSAWWRTFVASASGIAALGVTVRLAETAWPWVKGLTVALVHAMASGKL